MVRFARGLGLALLLPWFPLTLSAAEIQLNGQAFTLPAGFEIELVAGPPLVDRPITADFDEQGRLYVADSSGSNDKVDKQLAEKPHRIVRLEDVDGDGKFDRRTVFADKLMFPEGTLWYRGSLYVAAPPSIWKLTDRDGDGVADERVEWFAGKTLTGCANDLHGPYLGRDGWIYWCKGAFAQQTYDRPGREPLVTRAAHIFRARPDGTQVEPVMTGGMDNPVDVVFTPGGERIFSTTFFQHPGGGQRDGLIHAVYGGVYGKPHDVLEGHARTGPDLLPVLVHMGPAAPAGLACYDSSAFGPEYQHNLFAAQFNLQKVSRHVLEPAGGTFKTQDSDFVVSSNRDFHPTDVLEDADGSLLVVDTGGWYKLCCPTSQLSKPDVYGAIYRVRRSGAAKAQNPPAKILDPRAKEVSWNKLKAAELAKYLGDARPAAIRRATEGLVDLGAAAGVDLAAYYAAEPTSAGRRNAVWAAAQLPGEEARKLPRAALADRDESVRAAAAHAVGLVRDADVVDALAKLLVDPAPHVRRAAAEAIGRCGQTRATAPLLAAIPQAADRIVEHSLLYALVELGDVAALTAALADQQPAIQRGALIALDQLPRSGLKPEQVASLLGASDPRLKETAGWVLSRHGEWGETLTTHLAQQLKGALSADERRTLEAQLAGFARSLAVQKLLAAQLAGPPSAAQASALRAIAQAGLRETPPEWLTALGPLLKGSNAVDQAERLALAVAAARTLRVPKPRTSELEPLRAALLGVAGAEQQPAELRLDALAALPGGAGELTPAAFEFLRAQLAPEQSALSRATAADVLGNARLSAEQLLTLATALAVAGPLEIERLLVAYQGAQDDRVGLAVVDALRRSTVVGSLRVETLQPRLARFSPAVKQKAEELYGVIRAQQAQQHARLEELLKSLVEGDPRRGQLVFNSQKAACVSCHAIGYLGGAIGPDLTKIGQIRQQRDLLEAILYPSASFVRSYEPWTVVTVDGRAFTGVLRNEGAREITLVKAPREELRVLRTEIEELQPATVSIMPAGLDKQLSPQELADLLAFLRACK